MKDEIKEILDELNRRNDRYNYDLKEEISFSDEDYKSHILLDYITNLQEENERLKDTQKYAYIFVKKLHEKLKDALNAPAGIREMSMLEEMLKEESK